MNETRTKPNTVLIFSGMENKSMVGGYWLAVHSVQFIRDLVLSYLKEMNTQAAQDQAKVGQTLAAAAHVTGGPDCR